jgi:hypothetical protein
MNIGQMLAFGAGTFCLGVAFTFGLIFTVIARHGSADQHDGCLSTAISLAALMLAAYFFIRALTAA